MSDNINFPHAFVTDGGWPEFSGDRVMDAEVYQLMSDPEDRAPPPRCPTPPEELPNRIVRRRRDLGQHLGQITVTVWRASHPKRVRPRKPQVDPANPPAATDYGLELWIDYGGEG